MKFSYRYVKQIQKEIKRLYDKDGKSFDLRNYQILKDTIYAFSKSKSSLAKLCAAIWLPQDKSNTLLAEETLNLLLGEKKVEVRSRVVLGLLRIAKTKNTYNSLKSLIYKEKNHQIRAMACQCLCKLTCNYFHEFINETIEFVQVYAEKERKAMCLATILVGLWAIGDKNVNEDIGYIFDEFLSGDEQEIELRAISVVDILQIDLFLGYKERYNKVVKFIKGAKVPLLKYNRDVFIKILRLETTFNEDMDWNISNHHLLK